MNEKAIKFLSLGTFGLGVLVVFLCGIVTFVPGAESDYYGIAACLFGFSLISGRKIRRGVAAILLIVCVAQSYRGYVRGREYKTQLAVTYIREAAPMIFESGTVGVLPAAAWPTTLRLLNPKAVRLTDEGLYIIMSSFGVQEQGYFVVDPKSLFEPETGTDPSYRELGDGVFIYVIKG